MPASAQARARATEKKHSPPLMIAVTRGPRGRPTPSRGWADDNKPFMRPGWVPFDFPMRIFAVAALLALGAFAGCVADTPQPPVEPAAPPVDPMAGFIDPFLEGHDHSDAKLHAGLAFHARQTAHHPLGGTNVKSSGAHVVEVQGDWLFVGSYGFTADVDGGVYIFSLADPLKPVLTGKFSLPGNVGGDRSVEATDDAEWVVLGTEAIDCGNHVNPFGPGLYLLDVRDKANPKLADYVPDSGVHSVTIHAVDGVDYVVTLGADAAGKNIRKIDRAAARFVDVGSVAISHDASIYDDPLLGKPVLYVTGSTSLMVYDFSDPASLVPLGSWSPPNLKEKSHYVHAVAMDIVEGHRILALESEDWQDNPSPLWIVDATNFDDMTHVTTWYNPGNHSANAGGAQTLAFSTHNPRIENGTLYLAHYHGGVWILDISSLNKTQEPPVLGYFIPSEDNGGYKAQSSQSALPYPGPIGGPGNHPLCYGGFSMDEMPNVFDLEVRNGIVYAADLHTGLYTITQDPTVLPVAR